MTQHAQFDRSELPWEVQNRVPYAAQGVYPDFQSHGQLLLPYYQQPLASLGGPNGAGLFPINTPPAAFGHAHNAAQPYAFWHSSGDLLARMEGLQLNPRAKPFVLAPLERSKPGGRSACAGQPGQNAAYGEDKADATHGRACEHYSVPHSALGGSGSGVQVYGGGRGRVQSTQPSRTRSQNRWTATQKQMGGENIGRTVYISEIDQQVTEEQLAAAFQECGEVVDCRVCADSNSAMRFGFIEFQHEESLQKAIAVMNGAMVGAYPLKVQPSKTAIKPVGDQFLPRTAEERERCGRTVYVTNIDKKVDKQHVLAFFEKQCGPVSRIRLKGNQQHQARIAFVEFQEAKHAKEALDCSGALLGSFPIRVAPSKAPVRDDPPSR